MSSLASAADARLPSGAENPKPKLDHPTDIRAILVFLAILAGGLGFTAWSIWKDILATGAPVTT